MTDERPPATLDESPEERPTAEQPAQPPPAGPSEHPPGRLNRRLFLVASAATGVAATTASLTVARAQAQEATPAAGPDTVREGATPAATVTGEQPMAPTGAAPGGFAYFVPYQAAIVQAAAARLIPTDELGPGATEAGVVYFIDRQLANEREGYRGYWYDQGPYRPGEATQGDQSALPMRERFRLGIVGMDDYARQTFGRGFAQLAPDEQDRVLRDMEAGVADADGAAAVTASPIQTGSATGAGAPGQSGIAAKAFFELLLAYTVAGFFADPVHGGNRDMVGWKLIGFPGAQMGYPDWILRYGEPFDGPYVSLGQYQTQMSGGM